MATGKLTALAVDRAHRDGRPVMHCDGVAYRPPLLPRLEEASIHHRLLRTAYELTQTNAETRQSSPTYWRDVLSQCGIADA
jgi:hypothetical protein